MIRGMLRTARYARSWKTGAEVFVDELVIERSGAIVPATLLRPASGGESLAGWIALGGISRMGRHHPQLVRFARALASSGAAVLVPEVPEWRSLELSPKVVGPTIQGCIELLRRRGDVAPGKLGLIGFSFGAPQVAIAAAREELSEHVAGIVLFGGYCCLERTMTCLLTGNHEWEGDAYTLRPDPFGGWVVASNHLTDIPGLEDAADVAAALHALAHEASERRISAWDPYHDAMIAQLRMSLPARRQPLFDLFATPSDRVHPEPQEGREMALRLAEACRRVEPLLDPATDLSRVDLPTQLIHGRGDRLIPFTEGHRLFGGLPEHARRSLTVTSLFNHTADHAPPSAVDRARENLKMLVAIRGLVSTVD
jgi:pimeloyl-ACP methyl ester carboxylesterase